MTQALPSRVRWSRRVRGGPTGAVVAELPRSRRAVALLVFVLGALSAVGPLATDLYLPAFPQIAADLGASESGIQLTLTSVMVGMALGQLVVGPLSDVWGRRPPLLVGIGVFTVASVLCAVAPSAGALVVLRFVQGVAGAAGAVVSRAVVRDLFEGDAAARFFSRLMLVVGLAPMLGPVLGGQLLLLGPWQLLFGVLAAAGALGFVLVLVALPETLPVGRRRGLDVVALGRSFGGLVRDGRFLGPAVTLGLNFAMTFTYVSAFSFVSQEELGASAQEFALVFGVNTVGMVLGTQANAWLIGRMELSRRLLAGLLGSVVSVGALLVLGLSGHASLVPVMGALFVMMVCTGFVSPNATTLAVSSQPVSLAGTGSALLGTLQFAVGGGLAVLAGLTGSGSASLVSMAVVMLGASVAAAVVFVVVMARGHARSVA
ncbi:multidrug effflux MFS transporter [Marinactinospora rubrisoli]|uniref:Multidrug effflux MFS transporter n=1 Tax=Marinactinospora rubrisoli TaxID=2715399 RepID=A0ABW2KM08_9ACTN